MYKQMGIDLLSLFIRVPVFLMFPRAYLTFHYKTSFKYTKQGIVEFAKIQQVKMRYMTEKILYFGLVLYLLLWKILFVKVLWVRKRDMNM